MPVERPESPPLGARRSGYKKKGGPRGRKPLTVTDPGLIEEYKRNYAAEQKKGKFDPSTGGLNNSTVVSKKEVANEDQGTTVVVVCKPIGQLEQKTEVQNKYFKNTRGAKGIVVQVATDAMSSQEELVGAQVSDTHAVTNSEESPASSGTLPSLVDYSPAVIGTQGSTDQASSQQSMASSMAAVSDGSSPQVEVAGSGRSGKRYRIFKSRAPAAAVPVVDELKAPVYGGADESPLPVSVEGTGQVVLVTHSQSAESMDTGVDMQPPSLTPDDSQQYTQSTEESTDNGDNGLVEEDPNLKLSVNPTGARESLAARLRKSEKGNESDSTDNVSECSENFPSQESQPDNTQASNTGTVRKFFKSKKSSSSGSDLQRKIFGGSPAKVNSQLIFVNFIEGYI